MKNSFLFFLITMIFFTSQFNQHAYAQRQPYYATDTSLVYGVKIIDRGDIVNARFCNVEYAKERQQLTPSEVSEYGLKGGRVYIARDIDVEGQTQRVFLERLLEGPATLYYFINESYKSFFVEWEDKPLVEISRESEQRQGMPFGSYLASITSDCENVREATKLVRFNKASLTKFFELYNNCEKRPFPAARIGRVEGLYQSKLRPHKSQEFDRIGRFDFVPVTEYAFGVFADLPLSQSDLSLHIELQFSQASYYYTDLYLIENPVHQTFDTAQELTFTAKRSAFAIPLMLTYAYPSNVLRPFIRFGGQYTYNAHANSEIQVDHLHIGKLEWFPQDFPVHQLGIVLGAGVNVPLWNRHLAFIEFRNSYSYDVENLKNIQESNLYFLFGFAFAFGNNY